MSNNRTYPVELQKVEWDIIDKLIHQALHSSDIIYLSGGEWDVLASAHTKLKKRVLDIHEMDS